MAACPNRDEFRQGRLGALEVGAREHVCRHIVVREGMIAVFACLPLP